MSDSTPGRALITVAPNDTLDQVLDALRASTSDDLILEVDERSPLLLSLPQLHRLDEVAQALGVQVTVASANSKLLNAARVFGLTVIDLRDEPLPIQPAAEEAPRLLAGRPLDGTLGEAPVEEEPPVAEAPPLLRHSRVVNLTPIQRPQPEPEPIVREVAEPAAVDDPASAHADADEDAAAPVRYDRYGQPYRDDHDDEVYSPRRERRFVASGETDEAAAPTGWDDDAAEDYVDDQQPVRRTFWGDVRAWVAARRGAGADHDPADDDDFVAESAADTDDDGWDSPPYQSRPGSTRTIAAAHGGIESDPADRVEAVQPVREHTDRLPVITSAIAYDAAYPDETDEDEYVEAVDDEGWSSRDRLGGAGRFALGSVAFTVLILGLLVAIVLYLFLPTATVTLAARTGQVQTEFRIVVGEIDPSSPAGQPTAARIVVPAKRITVPLSATAAKPATGARLEPDVTAGGTVVLTNPSRSAVSVARGTALAATDGRTYVTTEAITIGPADPFGAGAFGSGTVKVAASIRGSGGNAAIGVVQGQLDNGIYYTNKTAPIAGGSDRRIPTISEQDREAARVAAEDAARAKGQAALAGAIPAGTTPMRDTTGVGNFQVKFSAAEGADGDSVTATVTAEVTALVYTPADVNTQARAEAERRLTAQVKPGEPIVAGSVQIGAPQIVEDVPGQITYTVTGGAQTRAVLGSEEERQRLAADLAHKDDADARALLNAIPGVASSTIQYQSGPFPERMPWLASHIQVQVQGAEVR